LAEGAELPEAERAGLKAAGLTGGLMAGIPAIAGTVRVAKNILKGTVEAGMKIKPWALKVLKKDPSILSKPQTSFLDIEGTIRKAKESIQRPSYIDVQSDITKKLKTLKEGISDKYTKSVNKLKAPKEAIISTESIPVRLKTLNMDISRVKSMLKTAARSEGIKFETTTIPGKLRLVGPENIMELGEKRTITAIDKFVEGQKLTHKEAKNINSLLALIERKIPSDIMGRGFIGKMGELKKILLNNWNTAIPGVKDINKKYAENLTFHNKIFRKLGDPLTAESSLRQIGKELSTKARSKTELAGMLGKLDKSIIDKLKKGAVSDKYIDDIESYLSGTKLRQIGQELAEVTKLKGQSIKDLKKLEEITGVKFLDQLKKTTAVDEFHNRFQTGAFGAVVRAAVPATLGGLAGGVHGMVGGMSVGAALQSPQVIQQAIRAIGAAERVGSRIAKRIPRAVKALPRQVTRVGAIKAGQRVQAPKREEDGSLTPSRMAQIKRERGI